MKKNDDEKKLTNEESVIQDNELAETSSSPIEETLDMRKLDSETDGLKIQSFDGPKPENDDPLNPENGEIKMSMKKDKKKKKVRSVHFKSRIVASILSFISVIGVTAVIVLAVLISSVIKESPEVTSASLDSQLVSQMYASNDQLIDYNFGEKYVDPIEYEDIPQSLIDAFVSIEDSRFFEHGGFDIPRFSSAMIKNAWDSVRTLSLSFDAGGASTLDMQLVRNSLFMKENIQTGETEMPASSGLGGIKRKIQEIYLATKVNSDNIVSKKVIFQMYVNKINFGTGSNMVGVQKAAEYYFDKNVTELNLVESAFLAGVINSPSNYTPYNSLTLATERTHDVLYYMNYHGYITDSEYQRALSVPLENLFAKSKSSSADTAYQYQAYIDLVLAEVKELTGGLSPMTTPMIIKTAMIPELQDELDAVQRREIDRLNIGSRSNLGNNHPLQLATTVIDNATGEVVGTIGGYDYNGALLLNRSVNQVYQPGSTVKPMISYAPAFEYLGYSTSHVFDDLPFAYPGTDFQVYNWNNVYHGQVTLRYAVSDSLNIPALTTFGEVEKKIGRDKYIDYVQSMGFKIYASHAENVNPSKFPSGTGREAFDMQFAVGGNNFYTNTQELASATSVLMNGGNAITAHTVREITILSTNEVIKPSYTATPVLSDAAAYLAAKTMFDLVEDQRTGGGAAQPTAKSYPVYGKTGTSNWSVDDAEHYQYVRANTGKDRLLLTATDRFSIATWTGFDPKQITDPYPGSVPYFTNYEYNFNLAGNLNSYILDQLTNLYGPGKALTRPQSVADITHILGTFPYQKPIDGMNESLLAKGLIKRDSLSLVESEPPALDQLQNATVNVVPKGSNYQVNIDITPYPDPTKLVEAPKALKILGLHGEELADGVRLYDPSWIYGPVRYQTDLKVNGTVVQTVRTEESKQVIDLPASTAGQIEVCSYYTFELNQDKRSGQKCTTIDTQSLSTTVPTFTTLNDVLDFADLYKIAINPTRTISTKLSDFNKIKSISPNLQGSTVKVSALTNSTWSVDVYDFAINAASYINTVSVDNFKVMYGNHFNITTTGTGTTITGISDRNGNPLTTFNVSDHYMQKIILSTN